MAENRYGAQIYTLEQLNEAVNRNWKVILIPRKGKTLDVLNAHPFWQGYEPEPASIVIKFSGRTLLELFSYGLFRYLEKP